MRSVLKLLVSIIVICIIGFTTYFLLSSASKYDSFVEDNNVVEHEQKSDNEEKPSTNIEQPESGEIVEPLPESGDINITEDEMNMLMVRIDEIRKQNNSANIKKNIEDNVGLDIIGEKYRDFFTTFEMQEIFVDVQVAGSMVHVIPASDFVDLVQFHFDENGKLLLYVDGLIGVGGEIRYYFSDDNLIATQSQVEEGVVINYEETNDILKRANLVFEKYMK